MLNLVICDDSTDYLEIIKFKINKCLKELETEAEITTFDTLDALEKHLESFTPDILFLDIVFQDESSVNWCIEHMHNTGTHKFSARGV